METDKNCHLALLLARTTHLTGKSIARKFQEEDVDLTVEQYALLNMLDDGDKRIQQELAEFMKKDKSAVLRSIAALEKRGYISRATDTGDRRKKQLEVTLAGKEVLLKAKKLSLAVVYALQKGLAAEELQVFEKVMLHIQNNANEQLLIS